MEIEYEDLTRALTLMDRNIQGRLDGWWTYTEERRARNVKIAWAAVVVVMALCGVIVWHNDRLLKLEREMKVVQEKCGVATTSAGTW
jgi:hypothetical protein